ncbi:MAG TPA: hypothetical protein VF898_02290 [Chloroflexota bacterium]
MSNIQIVIAGGVWRVASVSVQPELFLRDWTVYEIQPKLTRHFVGYNMQDREGRVSSAVQTFDPSTGTGITKSGRTYQLIGAPGHDPDGEYVWKRWCALQYTPVENFTDVSEEIWRSMVAQGQRAADEGPGAGSIEPGRRSTDDVS